MDGNEAQNNQYKMKPNLAPPVFNLRVEDSIYRV